MISKIGILPMIRFFCVKLYPRMEESVTIFRFNLLRLRRHPIIPRIFRVFYWQKNRYVQLNVFVKGTNKTEQINFDP